MTHTRERLYLLAILFAALAVRLIALDTRAFWYDEAFAVLFSERGVAAMIYGTLTPEKGIAADVHPLLYYTLLGGWMQIVGQTPFAVRLLSVIFGIATIAALYGLVRELFGSRPALFAAFITAFAPFHVQYSQEARMYALLALLTVGATWALVYGLRSKALWPWVVFGTLCGLSMYTQQLAAFYLAALGLIPLILRRRDKLLPLGIAVGLALLTYAPWLVNLPAQFGKISAYWIAQPTFSSALLTLFAFTAVEYPISDPLVTVISMAAFVAILFLVGWFITYRRNQQPWLLVWLILVPIAGMWLLSQLRAVYLTRALIPSAMMLYALIGVALAAFFTRRRGRTLKIAFVLVVTLSTITALITHYTWSTFPRPPFATIIAKANPGTRLVHASKITMLPSVYYARNQGKAIQQAYIRDVPGSGEDTLARPTQQILNLYAADCAAQAADGAVQITYVIFARQLAEQGGRDSGLEWLQAHYQAGAVVSHNDLELHSFSDPDATAQAHICPA